MKNFMVSTYSLNPSSCHVLVSTVSVQPIVYSSQISSELQIAKSSLHVREWVVYIGDIKASRDVGTLIKIFVKLKTLGYDVGLLVFGVGKPSDRKNFNHHVLEYGVDDRVVLFPEIPERYLVGALKNFSIGLSIYGYNYNRSLLYNSPLKLLNYMQANLCVCGTDIKDQAFVINSCKNGICVNDTVDNYVSGIIRLIKIPIEERNLMGKRGRDWLEKIGPYTTLHYLYLVCLANTI